MNRIKDNSIADLFFQLSWNSSLSRHTDSLMATNVNLWRDILPKPLVRRLYNRQIGDTIEISGNAAELISAAGLQECFSVKRGQFNTHGQSPLQPFTGRFYPKGLLSGVAGVFQENMTPFRCVELENGRIGVDFGHPLADRPLTVKATVGNVSSKNNEHGGTSAVWLEALTEGPGMQARWQNVPTDFFNDTAFSREDESDDSHFYQKPRLVQHIDRAAIDALHHLNGRFAKDGMQVLDLMSSWVTHLPPSSTDISISGLGLNLQELSANKRLAERVVHDLNRTPTLPYTDARFDLVLCSLSVEYLVRPAEVFREVARVLKPHGHFVITFSNRWFPPKVVRIWKELHDFERMGLVLELFTASGGFKDLQTYSMRGLPRPTDDKYYPAKRHADPIYAVWGTRTD